MIHDFYFDAHESKVIEIHSHHKVYQEIFMNVILKIFCKNLAYKNENDPTKIVSPYCEIVAITVVSSSIKGTLPNLQKCHLAHCTVVRITTDGAFINQIGLFYYTKNFDLNFPTQDNFIINIKTK